MDNARIFALVGLLFLCLASSFVVEVATSSLATLTSNGFYSSCTATEVCSTPQLPNLSFAKSSAHVTTNFSCDGISTDTAATPKVTWYYYSVYPPANFTDCCANSSCHDTAVSTMQWISFTKAVVGSDVLITATGSVISGPYNGLSASRAILFPLSDQTACSSVRGLESISGSTTLTITGVGVSVTCTGVHTEEYCPGIHFDTTTQLKQDSKTTCL